MFYRTCKIYKLEATRTIVRILYVIVKNTRQTKIYW